jgi:hypothetical protein
LDDEFDIESFIDYFQMRGAFTPKQLGLLLWRLERYGIIHARCKFKITIRRHREQTQLEEMQDWQIKKIWLYLTVAQRKKCVELRGETI